MTNHAKWQKQQEYAIMVKWGLVEGEKNTNQEITLKNPNPYELLEATGKWRWGVDGAKKSPYTLNYTGSMIFCRVTVMHEGSTFG